MGVGCEKSITKIVSRFPFFVEQSPLFSEQSPPFFLPSQKSSFSLQARDAFSRMGCLASLCWKARSRVASSGCEAAGADWAVSRHAASRADSLGRRSGSWSSGLWRMVNPSASEPADDSAAHFQIDCKSTREAGASWNEATGVDMTRLGAVHRCQNLMVLPALHGQLSQLH